MIWIWRFVEHRLSILLLIVCLLYRNLNFCWSLNDEGLVLLGFEDGGVINPSGHSSNWIQDIRIRDPYSSDRDVVLNNAKTGNAPHRKLLQNPDADPAIKGTKSSIATHSPLLSPSPSPKASASLSFSSSSLRSHAPDSSSSPSPPPSNAPSPDTSPHSLISPTSSPIAESPSIPFKSSTSSSHRALIMSAAIGVPSLILSLAIGMFFCRGNKIVSVRPWATGLSGQLQKALVTGVPNLKRSELETACEDFSNVIDSSSVGTVYKGTLSSGVEIAVASVAEKSAHNWSHNLETQFKDKISSLSRVNHKNFVNLLGYCKEDTLFTRMLVFEYAPNGTLFEHLHIKEAEHLEWGMRMRITMGIAYCLDHMHQLKPPIAHKNLNSSSVNLTEDYASKVSDFVFLNKVAAADMGSHLESNVYSFGVILFEIVTGILPYSVDSGSIGDWALDYMRGNRSLGDMVDPTLKSFQEEQIKPIDEVIKSCVNPNPDLRPQMREVSTRLREITAIGPDGAVPKLSPLWWAELEIVSIDECVDR